MKKIFVFKNGTKYLTEIALLCANYVLYLNVYGTEQYQ